MLYILVKSLTFNDIEKIFSASNQNSDISSVIKKKKKSGGVLIANVEPVLNIQNKFYMVIVCNYL